MYLTLQKFTKIEVQNSHLNQVINCTTSSINVAVVGHDCFINRSLLNFSSASTFNLNLPKILLSGKSLAIYEKYTYTLMPWNILHNFHKLLLCI